MAGSLGLGLNLGAGTSGGGGGQASAFTGGTGACFFELEEASILRPLAAGTVTDYNIVWDLDGTDYVPQRIPVSDCYWDVDGSSGSYEIKPKDV